MDSLTGYPVISASTLAPYSLMEAAISCRRDSGRLQVLPGDQSEGLTASAMQSVLPPADDRFHKKERTLIRGSVPVGNTVGFCNPRCQQPVPNAGLFTTSQIGSRLWLAGIMLLQDFSNPGVDVAQFHAAVGPSDAEVGVPLDIFPFRL